MKRFLLGVTLLALCSTGAFAQSVAPAPPVLNFQGRLSKPNGTPVPDGAYSVRLSLHDALMGGTEKWSQTVPNLQVKNGVFAALLSGFPAGTFHGDLWLEIKVGEDAPLSPRQQLVSVAFAMKANSVPDGAIGTNQLADGAVTVEKFASNVLNPLAWLLGGNSGTNPASHFIGTTDNQPLVFRTNNAERMRIAANGRVSVGNTSPSDPYALTLRSPDTTQGALLFRNNGNLDRWHLALSASGNSNGLNFVESGVAENRLFLAPGGNIGIGTNAPNALLDVRGAAFVGGFRLTTGANNGRVLLSNGSGDGAWGQVGVSGIANNAVTEAQLAQSFASLTRVSGGILTSDGSSVLLSNASNGFKIEQGANDNPGLILTGSNNAGSGLRFVNSSANGHAYSLFANNSGGLVIRDETLNVPRFSIDTAGVTNVTVLRVIGGSDVAEPFDIRGDARPGMVVSIDADKTGKLRIANRAYDRTVAGVISGANGVRPGLTLTQEGTDAHGKHPVAMTGRVWVWCDADRNGAIRPGDLLTSSATPGHAMRVTNHGRANGAILGKAMSRLAKGRGLVLVLIGLQ